MPGEDRELPSNKRKAPDTVSPDKNNSKKSNMSATSADIEDLKTLIVGMSGRLETMNKDNNSRINTNAREITNLQDSHSAFAANTTANLSNLENKIDAITKKIDQAGTPAPMDDASYWEASHERQLQDLIARSEFCVTLLNAGTDKMSTKAAGQLLVSNGYALSERMDKSLLERLQLNPVVGVKSPYKLTMDSVAAAKFPWS